MIRARTATLLLSLLFVSNTAITDDLAPQAEILHWWTSPSESAALNVFIEEFKARGGEIFNTKMTDHPTGRAEAIERMSKGYAPTLTQWHAGRDMHEFYSFGLIDAISHPPLLKKLNDSLPPAILDTVTHKDKIIAIPINLHSENWMWFSREHLSEQAANAPQNWPKLIEHGKTLAGQDIPLLAVGDQLWQVRILFTSVFLSAAKESYQQFYLERDPSVLQSEDFHQTLTLFSQLARYSKSFGNNAWNTQIKAVADNHAAATFMGDWANGELKQLGKAPGQHYGCALASGNDPSLLLVVDAFILGKAQDEAEKAGQNLMLDIVSDPKLNQKFNQMKGSLSPYRQESAESLDMCGAQAHAALNTEGAVVAPYASYRDSAQMNKIDNEIYALWKASVAGANTDTAVAIAIENLTAVFNNTALPNRRELATFDD